MNFAGDSYDANSVIIDSALGVMGAGPSNIQAFLDEVQWLTKYLEGYQAPKFPFPIDQAKAAAGKTVFDANCARCHASQRTGTVVSVGEVGTDEERIKSWNKQAAIRSNETVKGLGIERRGLVEADPTGYVAAFLDGIWLRAPYLHNGSVPTLRDLLKPRGASGPQVFYRGYDVYDPVDVGFISQEEQAKRLGVPWEAVTAVATPYDVRWRSNGNKGHEYRRDPPAGRQGRAARVSEDAMNAPAADRPPTRREWTSIGVRGFAWVAGIALVLGAVFLFRAAGGHPWLRAAAGLVLGVALIVVAERWLAAKYRVSAERARRRRDRDPLRDVLRVPTRGGRSSRWPSLSSGCCWSRWRRWSSPPDAIRSSSPSSGCWAASSPPSCCRRPRTIRSRSSRTCWPSTSASPGWPRGGGWWLLSALATVITALYEWGWALQAITVGLLPLAATIFAVFAVVGTVPLWYGRPDDRPAWIRWIAAAAAHLPLLFAVYVAAHVNYGPQYNVLFGFLLIVAAGLMAIVWRGGPKWLHAMGGVATLVTFAVWLGVSYIHASWPWLLVWLALFIVLYLIKFTPFAGLLFGVFVGDRHSRAAVVARDRGGDAGDARGRAGRGLPQGRTVAMRALRVSGSGCVRARSGAGRRRARRRRVVRHPDGAASAAVDADRPARAALRRALRGRMEAGAPRARHPGHPVLRGDGDHRALDVAVGAVPRRGRCWRSASFRTCSSSPIRWRSTRGQGHRSIRPSPRDWPASSCWSSPG